MLGLGLALRSVQLTRVLTTANRAKIVLQRSYITFNLHLKQLTRACQALSAVIAREN